MTASPIKVAPNLPWSVAYGFDTGATYNMTPARAEEWAVALLRAAAIARAKNDPNSESEELKALRERNEVLERALDRAKFALAGPEAKP